ncbi:hypothetical protein TNCV_2646421 [Trichonephila clavipes]|nr:hypothetical protein TNCV_2646421 [Trichonephila clavipes]
MRLQKRKGTVDGYEWRCRNQSKDNRHDVVRSVRKGTWFSESKLAITIILHLTRYWFDKSMNEFVMNDLKVNKNMTKLIRHMWRRSYDHKLVNENFHKFLASIARVYQPTDHDEMQAFRSIPTSLWPPPAKKNAPYACSEPWVHFRANFTKQKRGILNSRRAASPLMRLVEGEEMWVASDHPQCVLPLNGGGTESDHTVICMVLKAMANDRRPWLEHRTPDRKAWVRCHQIPSQHTWSTCSLNQWIRSLVCFVTSAGTGEYFPPLQFPCRNCGGEDRGGVAIYRPFEEFYRAKSYCHLYGAQGQRQAYL